MKVCTKCSVGKEACEFGNRKRSKDGLEFVCKVCKNRNNASYHKKTYKHRREKVIETKKKRHESISHIVSSLKVKCGCVDCGYNENSAALQFDHLGDKQFGISQMISDGFGIKRIMSEVNKCEVRCANCHSIKTAKDFNWYHIVN